MAAPLWLSQRGASLRLDAAGKPSFVRFVVSDHPYDGGSIGLAELGDYFSARSVATAMRS
jgi:hypothetical protein